MKKLERLEREAQRTREKIAAMQSLLKELDGKRTEQEDLQIIKRIRALNLSREELYAFMSSGALPESLAGAIENAVTDTADTGTETDAANTGTGPETIYSRRDKNKKRNRHTHNAEAPDADNTEATEAPEGENHADSTGADGIDADPTNETQYTTHVESEVVNHEG